MANTLHIVNGDSTAKLLSKSSINGDIVVWREMLCEGPVINDVGTDNFWKIRYDFYENELGIKKLDYFDNSIKEIIKLEDLEGYKEVVLWFEYDLFCQVNLMALCFYLINLYNIDFFPKSFSNTRSSFAIILRKDVIAYLDDIFKLKLF